MNEMPQVVIVMARCSGSKQSFGIRFEEKARGQWAADWAFAVKETSASKEGYDRGKVTGNFWFDDGYPGCPYCRVRSIFRCGCGKVACWDGERRTVTCPWCNGAGELRGQIDALTAGTDR